LYFLLIWLAAAFNPKHMKMKVAVLTGLLVLIAMAYVWSAASTTVNLAPTMTAVPQAAPGAPGPEIATPATPLDLHGAMLMVGSADPGPNIGHLAWLAAAGQSGQVLPQRCERAHYANNIGICMMRNSVTPMSSVNTVTVFDRQGGTRFSFETDGIPSRARVSWDGRFAAYTVFLTGHDYNDPNLSTLTEIVDLNTQTRLGNLESFTVTNNGVVMRAPDFNFWGVTFKRNSTLFYATLRTNGRIWLVEGDVAARSLKLLREGVECPSLSPDNTRLAYKRRVSATKWRLHMIDLATGEDTQLHELASIDDQVDWLSNQHLVYEWIDYGSQTARKVVALGLQDKTRTVIGENIYSPIAVR
jgi:hypothetical protein